MSYTFHASDSVLAALSIYGPMTLENLSHRLRRDNYVVNNWLFMLKRKRQVELIERKKHCNRRGMKCGRWRVVTDERTAKRPV